MNAKYFQNISVWVWAVALMPWVWIVPMNSYFFDDWGTAPLRSWLDHVARWQATGKHYLNPVMYFLLTPFGPWIFHVLMIISIVVIATSLSAIVSKTNLLSAGLSKWVGPMCLAMPVFDARFASSVLEYCFGLASLLSAWRLFISPRSKAKELLALALLVYAIGVPSLAILFVPLWLHITVRESSNQDWIGRISTGLRYLTILAIPIVYVFIFQAFVNSGGRYGPALGGIGTFFRGLLVLLILGGVGLSVLWHRQRGGFNAWLLTGGLGTAAYFGFFPYYAVGYSPFDHLFLWRNNRPETWMPFVVVPVGAFILLTAWLLVTAKLARREFLNVLVGGLPVMAFVIFFGTSAYALGPFGWESRHHLIFWPLITVSLLALIAAARKDHQQILAAASFVVLLVATLGISSEWFVDSILQKSIVKAVAVDLKPVPTGRAGISYVVVIDPTAGYAKLGARGRGGDAAEWRGLIASGLDIEPFSMRLLHLNDFASQARRKCAEPIDATYFRPEILSSRLEVLTRFQVRLRLNAQAISVCDVSENYPWWSNPSPLAGRSSAQE